MKNFALLIAAILLVGCSSTGYSGMSGSSGTGGTGAAGVPSDVDQAVSRGSTHDYNPGKSRYGG